MKSRGFLEWSKVLEWVDERLDVEDVKEELSHYVWTEDGVFDVRTGREAGDDFWRVRRELERRRLETLRKEVKRRLESKERRVVMKVGDIEVFEDVEEVRLDDVIDDLVRAVKKSRNLWSWLLGRQRLREDWDILRDGFEFVKGRTQWVEEREDACIRQLKKFMVKTEDGKTKIVVHSRFELGLVRRLLRRLRSLQFEKKRLKKMEERLRRAWREKKKELEKKDEEEVEIVLVEQ